MGIYKVDYHANNDMLSVQAKHMEQGAQKDNSGKSEEKKTLDDIELSSMGEKLSAIASYSATVNPVEALDSDLTSLKERFMNSLSDALNSAGIEAEKNFIVKKEDDGTLSVHGDVKQREAIEELLNSDETLKAAFDTISEQGELVNSVQSNARYNALHSGLKAYEQMSSMGGGLASYLFNMQSQSMTPFF